MLPSLFPFIFMSHFLQFAHFFVNGAEMTKLPSLREDGCGSPGSCNAIIPKSIVV